MTQPAQFRRDALGRAALCALGIGALASYIVWLVAWDAALRLSQWEVRTAEVLNAHVDRDGADEGLWRVYVRVRNARFENDYRASYTGEFEESGAIVKLLVAPGDDQKLRTYVEPSHWLVWRWFVYGSGCVLALIVLVERKLVLSRLFSRAPNRP